jgi:hypothetical protein
VPPPGESAADAGLGTGSGEPPVRDAVPALVWVMKTAQNMMRAPL